MDDAELTGHAKPVDQEENITKRGNSARNHLLARVSGSLFRPIKA